MHGGSGNGQATKPTQQTKSSATPTKASFWRTEDKKYRGSRPF
jgi:hypothetical protein